jgi:MYXO-CTERM domain-containing protein
MSIRRVTRTIVKSLAATAITGSALIMFSGSAGAIGGSGSIVPNSAVAQAPFTAGTPFSSGQGVNIVIPANTVLTPGANILILECAAPGGVLPVDSSSCDGNTTNGPSEQVNADGSINFLNDTGTLYTLYALPNLHSLGEQTNHLPICNTSNACVLYVGQNQNDFTQPHFFTQTFLISTNATDSGANPGDGLPEVPYAIVLPLAAMGLLGGAVLIRRRRSVKTDVKTAA